MQQLPYRAFILFFVDIRLTSGILRGIYLLSLLGELAFVYSIIAATDTFYLSVHEFYGKDVATLITGGFF